MGRILSDDKKYIAIATHRRISSSGVTRYRSSCSECPYKSPWRGYPGHAEQAGVQHAKMKHGATPEQLRTMRYDDH